MLMSSYSKEKVTEDSKKKKEKKQMEFWPLIKVVRIYTKAEALSTGAVIVDLPGVHDSNAARAAVAAGKKNLHLHVDSSEMDPILFPNQIPVSPGSVGFEHSSLTVFLLQEILSMLTWVQVT
jgi:hypothetical protein